MLRSAIRLGARQKRVRAYTTQGFARPSPLAPYRSVAGKRGHSLSGLSRDESNEGTSRNTIILLQCSTYQRWQWWKRRGTAWIEYYTIYSRARGAKVGGNDNWSKNQGNVKNRYVPRHCGACCNLRLLGYQGVNANKIVRKHNFFACVWCRKGKPWSHHEAWQPAESVWARPRRTARRAKKHNRQGWI